MNETEFSVLSTQAKNAKYSNGFMLSVLFFLICLHGCLYFYDLLHAFLFFEIHMNTFAHFFFLLINFLKTGTHKNINACLIYDTRTHKMTIPSYQRQIRDTVCVRVFFFTRSTIFVYGI